MSENFEKNLETKQYNIDSVTGYVDETISPKSKSSFLKLLKTIGNPSLAADRQGVTWDEMQEELKKDKVFNKAYLAVLTDMKHALESILYLKALENKDVKSALSWLSAKFPEEYKAGTKKTEKKDNKDKLFDRLLND